MYNFGHILKFNTSLVAKLRSNSLYFQLDIFILKEI